MRGFLHGLVLAWLLVGSVSAQTVIDTTPAKLVQWDQPAASLAEANAYRITAYSGANATKVIANPNDATAVAVTGGNPVALTCTTGSTVPGAFLCTSTTLTMGQIPGTTAFGTYTTALVGERRKADGTYAPRAVSAACTFRFADTGPSDAPVNVRPAP